MWPLRAQSNAVHWSSNHIYTKLMPPEGGSRGTWGYSQKAVFADSHLEDDLSATFLLESEGKFPHTRMVLRLKRGPCVGGEKSILLNPVSNPRPQALASATCMPLEPLGYTRLTPAQAINL